MSEPRTKAATDWRFEELLRQMFHDMNGGREHCHHAEKMTAECLTEARAAVKHPAMQRLREDIAPSEATTSLKEALADAHSDFLDQVSEEASAGCIEPYLAAHPAMHPFVVAPGDVKRLSRALHWALSFIEAEDPPDEWDRTDAADDVRDYSNARGLLAEVSQEDGK